MGSDTQAATGPPARVVGRRRTPASRPRGPGRSGKLLSPAVTVRFPTHKRCIHAHNEVVLENSPVDAIRRAHLKERGLLLKERGMRVPGHSLLLMAGDVLAGPPYPLRRSIKQKPRVAAMRRPPAAPRYVTAGCGAGAGRGSPSSSSRTAARSHVCTACGLRLRAGVLTSARRRDNCLRGRRDELVKANPG